MVRWSHFHLCPLQSLLRPHSHLIERKKSFSLLLPRSIKSSLNWWLAPRHLEAGVSMESPQRLVLTTELIGVGEQLGNNLAQGKCMSSDLCNPINRLELKVVHLALLTFSKQVLDAHILVQTDNMATKTCINCQGGTRSKGMMKETTLLFQWVEIHLQSIKAEHLPRLDNLEADWLSRRDVIEEWGLHPEVFNVLVRRFGQSKLDLFASQENAKTPAFFSRARDSLAQGTNALHIPWPQGLL